MLKTLRNAFKIEDIRKKLIFTFLMLIVDTVWFPASNPRCKQNLFPGMVRKTDR